MTTYPRSRKLAVLFGAGLLTMALAGLSGCGSDPTDTAASAGSPSASASFDATAGAPEAGTADAAAWEALLGVDGEYNSAAQYAAVVDKFGAVEPYISILAAENHHSDMLAMHLRRAGYDVPANPYLGAVTAPADLVTAAQAWADGEVRNIAMYDALTAQAKDDAHLTMMFSHLKGASKNAHLPLFKLAAENGGKLTQEQMAKWSPSMIMMGTERGMEMGSMGGEMGSMGGMNMGGDMNGMNHDMGNMSPSPAN